MSTRTKNGKLTPPLKWHGGKHYLATKIMALMPPHLHYVEPYAGWLAVLLAKNPLARREWEKAAAHVCGSDPVADAVAFFVCYRQSLAWRRFSFTTAPGWWADFGG
jgi:site-specific DNA-adenine methylase